MKITHVISDSNVGGAGVVLCSLVSALKKNFEIEVIIPRGSALKERLLSSGISPKEMRLTADSSFSVSDTILFYRYFSKNKTDILHTHASLSSRLGGALAGIRACISTRHCAKSDSSVRKLRNLQIKLYNFCTHLTVSTADCATKNLIYEGLDKQKIVTIKNGSPKKTRISNSDAISLRQSLGIPLDARIIGSCARLEHVKGQDLLLRAAPRILKLIPRVHFLFVGDGKARHEYERLAARLGISGYVTFVGFTPSPEKYESLFYVNVNTSRGTETSCLATSECMSFGIPTVASDFGGNTEMITPYANGLIFDTDNHFSLEDALIKLLADSELYKTLCIGALNSYEKSFSVERMAEEYKNLYESLAARLV